VMRSHLPRRLSLFPDTAPRRRAVTPRRSVNAWRKRRNGGRRRRALEGVSTAMVRLRTSRTRVCRANDRSAAFARSIRWRWRVARSIAGTRRRYRFRSLRRGGARSHRRDGRSRRQFSTNVREVRRRVLLYATVSLYQILSHVVRFERRRRTCRVV
jgi:hypothetical protein